MSSSRENLIESGLQLLKNNKTIQLNFDTEFPIELEISRGTSVKTRRNRVIISSGDQKIEQCQVEDCEQVLTELQEVFRSLWPKQNFRREFDPIVEINGWSPKRRTESGVLYAWESKNGNVVKIGVGNSVQTPIPENVYPNESSVEVAVVRACCFMRKHSAKEIDIKLAIKPIAEELFQEITGIGESKAEEITSSGIYSLDFDVSEFVQDQYAATAREELQTLSQEVTLRQEPSVVEAAELYE